MKFTVQIFVTLALFLVSTTSLRAQKSLPMGSDVPMINESLEDINGRSINLSQSAKQNGLLVIFSCNTCPTVSRLEDRIKSIASYADANNIGMIAINPNERIRDRGESIGDMKRRSIKQGYNFSYALDKDHKIADAFGATRTPEVFLFDGNMKLVYKGTVDDNVFRPEEVKNKYLENAMGSLTEGIVIKINKTAPKGCSIKRIE